MQALYRDCLQLTCPVRASNLVCSRRSIYRQHQATPSNHTHKHNRQIYTDRQTDTPIGRKTKDTLNIKSGQLKYNAKRFALVKLVIRNSGSKTNKQTYALLAFAYYFEKQYIENLPCYPDHAYHTPLCMCAMVCLQSFNLTLHNIVSLPHYTSLVNQPNKQTNQLRVFEIKCKTFLKNC